MVVNGQPGFTKESFEALANITKKEQVHCNLIINEMCIRKQIEMDTQRNTYGFVNLGIQH